MADHRGTVGRAVVGKVKILDENDQEVPTGQIGTVYFADAPVFTYHNDPEKTKRAYNAKGWSTLGDVGYLDDEGFLYLTDRKSYMIISGGVNIYPQETEDVLITHPGVADVAVFGVPNEEMGEEVKAVVQPHDMARAGKELEAELIAVLPQTSVADQMPEEHRLRSRAAAHADRQAGEAASARPLLAEGGGEGLEIVGWARRACAVPTKSHFRKAGGHAEPVIGRAFARPVGFAHPTKPQTCFRHARACPGHPRLYSLAA